MPAKLQLALFGAVPALLAMAYFDRLDAKRPEPRRTLRMVALAGALSAIPVVVLGKLLQAIGPEGMQGPHATYLGALYFAFVIAALPEEAAKLGSMLLFAWRRPEFDERMDGIVYGARAGLGFALVENVAYLLVMPASLSDYIAVFVGRAVLAVPGHATWGGIIGYFAARRRFDGRGPGLLGGYLLAVGLHGIYDFFLFCAPIAMAKGQTWVGLGIAGIPIVAYLVPSLIILFGALTLRQLARRAIAADDLDEAHGRLVRSSAPIVSSSRQSPSPSPAAPWPSSPAPPAAGWPSTPSGTVVAGPPPPRTPGGTVISTGNPPPPAASAAPFPPPIPAASPPPPPPPIPAASPPPPPPPSSNPAATPPPPPQDVPVQRRRAETMVLRPKKPSALQGNDD